MREIRCNKCNKMFDQFDMEQGFSIYHRIGYDSKYDGGRLAVDLCSDCMDDLIDIMKDEFIIPPIIFEKEITKATAVTETEPDFSGLWF